MITNIATDMFEISLEVGDQVIFASGARGQIHYFLVP